MHCKGDLCIYSKTLRIRPTTCTALQLSVDLVRGQGPGEGTTFVFSASGTTNHQGFDDRTSKSLLFITATGIRIFAMHSAAPPLMTDELPLRIEPAEADGAEQFRVSSARDILGFLHRLAEHHELVCVYFDATDRFGLSSVLAVVDEGVILDVPSGSYRSDLLASEMLLCVSALQRVKLQFEITGPRLVEWQERPAVQAALPRNMLRLQRRDFYRLTVPMGEPLTCFVPYGHGEEHEISLVDLSVGGVGILGYVPGLRLTAGAIYAGIRIELADTGTVVADIEIRSSFDVRLRNGIRTVRTGARFIDLSGSMQSLIQRYITRIERERITRVAP